MTTLQTIGLVTHGLFSSYILFSPFPLHKRKKKVERDILLSGDFAVDLMGKEHMKILEHQYFTDSPGSSNWVLYSNSCCCSGGRNCLAFLQQLEDLLLDL